MLGSTGWGGLWMEEGTGAVLVSPPLHSTSSQPLWVLKSSCGGGEGGILFLNHRYRVCAQSWRFRGPPDPQPSVIVGSFSSPGESVLQSHSYRTSPGPAPLHQELANYVPWATSGLQIIVINKVLLAHNHAHSFIQLVCNGFHTTMAELGPREFPILAPLFLLKDLKWFLFPTFSLTDTLCYDTSMEPVTIAAMLKDECGRLNNVPLPKYIHVLLPRTCECYFNWQKELCRWD